jgi:dipeptidase D
MSEAIKGLKPELLWKYFAEMCAIPHKSKHEAQMIEYLKGLGAKYNYETKVDEVGTVLIKIPATKGYEDSPIVVIQGHMDMVCEQNEGTNHDFLTDPIKLVREGDWISADGTTLGADNGIGVAAGLAFLEDTDTVHGPLEILSTVDEETGLTGAFALKPDFLEGKILLNLDSEEDGALYVGCAGGADVKMFYDIVEAPVPAGQNILKINIKGLRGGHSGLNIIENRANALRILARLLKSVDSPYVLSQIDGGSAHNAIPRESEASIIVAKEDVDKVKNSITKSFDNIKIEYGKRDKGMVVEFDLVENKAANAFSRDLTERLIDSLLLVPNGLLTLSQDLPNLVESSCNLATVKLKENQIAVQLSCRSSVDSVIPEIQGSCQIAGERLGAKVELGGGYPGWQPDMDSPLLAKSKKVFKELFGKEPLIKAIHAGLECGVIGKKYPGMTMISFGPEIHGAHSPDEKILIPTVERFWDLLKGLLTQIAKDK